MRLLVCFLIMSLLTIGVVAAPAPPLRTDFTKHPWNYSWGGAKGVIFLYENGQCQTHIARTVWYGSYVVKQNGKFVTLTIKEYHDETQWYQTTMRLKLLNRHEFNGTGNSRLFDNPVDNSYPTVNVTLAKKTD